MRAAEINLEKFNDYEGEQKMNFFLTRQDSMSEFFSKFQIQVIFSFCILELVREVFQQLIFDSSLSSLRDLKIVCNYYTRKFFLSRIGSRTVTKDRSLKNTLGECNNSQQNFNLNVENIKYLTISQIRYQVKKNDTLYWSGVDLTRYFFERGILTFGTHHVPLQSKLNQIVSWLGAVTHSKSCGSSFTVPIEGSLRELFAFCFDYEYPATD